MINYIKKIKDKYNRHLQCTLYKYKKKNQAISNVL